MQAHLVTLARSRIPLLAALCLAVAVILPAASVAVLSGLSHHWDGSRLAPLFGLARGFPLYPPPGEAPINGFMYGPMAAYAYFPCLLATTPTTAIVAGSLLALFYYLFPVWAVLWGPLRREGTTPPPWSVRAALGCLFLLLTLITPGLNYVAFRAHADAPALGLGAMGLIVLAGRGGGRWTPVLSAVLLVGAVAAKQTFLPLFLVGLGTVFLFHGGGRAAGVFLLTAGVTAALVAVGLLVSGAAPGLSAIYFNAIEVPRSYGWGLRDPTASALLARVLLVVRNLFSDNWFVISVATAALLLRGAGAPVPGDAPPALRRVSPGVVDLPLLLFVGAVACLPATVLGLIKAGGNVNNQAPFVYLAALSALGAGLRWLATTTSAPPQAAPAARAALAGLLVALSVANLPSASFLTWLLAAARPQPSPATYAHIHDNPGFTYFNGSAGVNSNQLAFRYEQAHPGTVYFPYNPLAALMAERQYTHFAMGLLDRESAKHAPTPAQLAAGIPAGAVYLAVPPGEDANHPRQSYPAFNQPVELPEFPGWQVFRRGDGGGGQP